MKLMRGMLTRSNSYCRLYITVSNRSAFSFHMMSLISSWADTINDYDEELLK